MEFPAPFLELPMVLIPGLVAAEVDHVPLELLHLLLENVTANPAPLAGLSGGGRPEGRPETPVNSRGKNIY